MAITSFSYLVFVFLVLCGCEWLRTRHTCRKWFLIMASYYFYMSWDWRFSGLLMILTLLNYAGGNLIFHCPSARRRKIYLSSAILASLSILFYFKYLNFFIDSANGLITLVAGGEKIPHVDVMLPIGISFITFQAITYPLDIYLKRLPGTHSLTDFVLFVAFFPRILSGPIVRAAFFMPQMAEGSKPVTDREKIEGLVLVGKGLAKKVLLADVLAAHIVDPAFAAPHGYSGLFLLFAVFSYSFQVYLDLSGYTDMAVGVGKMLGYRLPINFNRPYLATSISNFWQRWHITMSSFFRDYLYHGLKTRRGSNIYLNLLLVFVAIGIWHGAGWNFVLYGLIHGSLVSLEHYRSQRRENAGLSPIVYRGRRLVLQIFTIFSIVSFSRILFRCDSAESAFLFVSDLFSLSDEPFPASPLALAVFLMAALFHFTPAFYRDRVMLLVESLPPRILAPGFVMLAYLIVAISTQEAGFIYFQF
jgi:alginate O-acetyltransferase complex protein AlgI